MSDSESAVKAKIRLEAANKGLRLWRNNCGAVTTDTGSFVRFGLANESAAVNSRLKSADLIGIRPVVITPDMVGKLIGQFISVEVKREGWQYSGTEEEEAQVRWMQLIRDFGGDARIITKAGTL
jgi:hypothetical protein